MTVLSARLPWLAALLLLAACTSPLSRPATVAEPAPTTLLLVSVDGLPARLLGRGETPHLDAIAAAGVRAERMNPSYPSLTFPNHYTLVTGLRPNHHGIIHNSMRDEGLGDFRLSDRDAVGDGRWWGGEPIWIGAHRAGLRTAAMFWPGTEAPIQGLHPDAWFPFDVDMTEQARVDQVLAWFALPDAERPALMTLYFDKVDKAGHDHGPDSAQMHEAIRITDAAIGHLVDTLRARGQYDQVNLVIVSDHGMASVPAGQVIAVEDMVAPDDADVVSVGQVIGIAPKPGRTAAVERQLLGRHPPYTCWRRQELPARWAYGSHPRVPPIVCQMDEGWDALGAETIARRPVRDRGSHGYDPALPSMGAVFIAHGPAFAEGKVLPAFDNVHVYPLLARLLGIRAAPSDGDPAVLQPALRTR